MNWNNVGNSSRRELESLREKRFYLETFQCLQLTKRQHWNVSECNFHRPIIICISLPLSVEFKGERFGRRLRVAAR